MLANPVLVGTTGDIFYPGLVIEIPLDSLFDAGLKGFIGFPAEFAFDLGGVDGVALVVPWAVGHRDLLVPVAAAVRSGLQFVEQCAQAIDHFKVGLLVVAAYVVGLAWHAALEHQTQRLGMVIDIKPVADVVTLAVDGQGLV